MVLADRLHECCLRPLVSYGFGETDFLPNTQTVKSIFGYAVAVKVDLASVRRGYESMIVFGSKRPDDAMRRHLVGLDVTLSFADEILELAASYIECVPDRDLDVFVPPCGRRIAAYGDIRGAGDRQVDTNTVRVTLVMAVLRAPDDDARRRDAIEKLLELLGLFARTLLDVIHGCNVLEGNLQRNLHDYSLPPIRTRDLSCEMRRLRITLPSNAREIARFVIVRFDFAFIGIDYRMPDAPRQMHIRCRDQDPVRMLFDSHDPLQRVLSLLLAFYIAGKTDDLGAMRTRGIGRQA